MYQGTHVRWSLIAHHILGTSLINKRRWLIYVVKPSTVRWPVLIMPIRTGQTLSNLVVFLSSLEDWHVDFYNLHGFSVIKPSDRTCKWHSDLRKAAVIRTRRARRIDENHSFYNASANIGESLYHRRHVLGVCSKALATTAELMNLTSDSVFHIIPLKPASIFSQNDGMIMVWAPCRMSSLNASGKLRSQHISIPTVPIGESKASEVRGQMIPAGAVQNA